MTWLTPIAFAGLATLVIPILIHLLVRQQSRRLPFPSLRFLQPTPLASIRRRALSDWPLLAMRMLVIAAGVAALASPVVRWPGRERAWASRVSRAVVVERGIGPRSPLPAESFRLAVFARDDGRTSLREAIDWLESQPASAREVVLSGRFRRGWISPADVASVPPWVGIRIDKGDEPSPREQRLAFAERRGGQLHRVTRSVGLGDAITEVREISAEKVEQAPIVVTAGATERAAADAALEAILTRGVRWPAREITVTWPGSAAALAAAIDRAVETPLDAIEPARVPDETVARWARPPGPPPAHAPIADEGDRRYFWGLALLLLAGEWWLRRRRPATGIPQAQEARVA